VTVSRWAFDNNQEVVLCCSSTRHRRFIDDLVNVMALPSGSRIPLRYGEDVCDPQIRQWGEDAPIPVPNRLAALIVHVKFDDEQAEFLPLRVGEVVEIRTEGTVTYLEVELGPFVEQPMGGEFRDKLKLLATLDLPYKPADAKKPIGRFCQRLKSAPALISGTNTKSWERVAERFMSAIHKSNADFPFIFHMEIFQTGAWGAKPVPVRAGMLWAPAASKLELRIRTLADKTAFNSIIQNAVGTLKLNVDHPDCQLTSRSDLSIDTTRNLLTCRMATRIALRVAYGAIVLTASRGESNAMHQSKADSTDTDNDADERPAPVDKVIVELPLTVGKTFTRVAAAASVALAAAAHEFDLKELDLHMEWVLAKAGIVFLLVFAALYYGLKPQGGG